VPAAFRATPREADGHWPLMRMDDYDWLVSQTPIGFGSYLRDAIHAAGFATPTHFAREVGTDPSVVLRWISEEQRPTIRSIERIAPVLGRSINEVVHAAYPDRLGLSDQPAASRLHPIAYDIGRVLADDSPVSLEDRRALESVLDRMIDPYRRELRRRRLA
jgi:transcriptional regulator with XRE-family HTH domain